jgi:hypothetical protein
VGCTPEQKAECMKHAGMGEGASCCAHKGEGSSCMEGCSHGCKTKEECMKNCGEKCAASHKE